jgi:hypothetical protein
MPHTDTPVQLRLRCETCGYEETLGYADMSPLAYQYFHCNTAMTGRFVRVEPEQMALVEHDG